MDKAIDRTAKIESRNSLHFEGGGMLELNKGVDILSEVGGIRTAEEARSVLAASIDASNREKIARISTAGALIKIANAAAMCAPDRVFVIGSSPDDVAACRRISLETGEECPLDMKDHTIHFDLPEDQGRMVDQTYYIANEGEEVSVLAKKMLRAEALDYVRATMTGIMRGKTMLVGFCAGAHGRAGIRSRAHDLKLGVRPAQREHPLPQCLRGLRQRSRTSRYVLYEPPQPGERQIRGHLQGAGISWTEAGSRRSACTARTRATR